MPTLDPRTSTLALIDFQVKLMPAIDGGEAAVANARRLADAAALVDVPVIYTEQYPQGLGRTVPELAPAADGVLEKMCFSAGGAEGFMERLGARENTAVLAGVEAHICVLQTALGLLAGGRRVCVVRDAIASRKPESVEVALRRMEQAGAEIVTTEMVIFEWIGSAAHPKFREAARLIR